MKKYLLLPLIFIFSLFLISCKKESIVTISNKLEITRNDTTLISIYNGSLIDLDIDVAYNDININTYFVVRNDIKWEDSIGTETVEILYENEKASFEIKYLKLNEINENDDVFTEGPIYSIKGVKYGTTRGTNEIICYDNTNYIKTNIYGYEIQIDKFLCITKKAVNVDLLDGGMIISAHGTSKSILENLEIGSFVFYSKSLKTAFVFSKTQSESIKYIIRLDELNTLTQNYKKIKENNILIDNINNINLLIDYFNKSKYTEFDELYESVNKTIKISDEYERQYGTSSLHIDIQKQEYTKENLSHLNDYKVDHIGGYRDTNQLVCYKSDKNTNIYGYEVAVDKDGFVIDKAINVDIPKGGFVISAHGERKAVLQENIEIGDVLIFDENTLILSIYRNLFVYTLNDYYNKITKLSNIYNEYLNENIPLYYDSFKKEIEKTVNEYNSMCKLIACNNYSFKDIYKLSKAQIDESIIKAYSYLLINNPVTNKGLWHTPGNLSNMFDEYSESGVKAFIKEIKECGFNRVYLNILSHGGTYYDSAYLNYANDKFAKEYGEYKDYFECFIKEAKKEGIEVYVWAITMNFGTDTCKHASGVDSSFYTIDFNGNETKYLDSTNPKVQEFLCKIFKEIASYGPEGIEFDYIRYDSSNIKTTNNKNSVIDYGYTDYAISTFLKENGLTGDIHNLLFEVDGLKDKWISFKIKGITDSVIKIGDAVKSINSNINISAAVFSNPTTSITSVMQDSATFFLSSYIDEIEPMIYKDTLDSFIETTENFASKINERDNFYKYFNVGISPMLDGKDVCEYFMQMSYCEKQNFNYTIFSSGMIFREKQLIKYLKYANLGALTLNKPKDEKENATLLYLEIILSNYYKEIIDENTYNNIIKNTKNKDITSLKQAVFDIDNENVQEYILRLIDKYQ